MADNFIGEIRMAGFNFAPQGWALCNGQILPISQNTALFSLLGVQYGGNGTTNFALPNLQGCVPVDQGQALTGTQYVMGELSGVESVTLSQQQLPVHNHAPAQAVAGNARTDKHSPVSAEPAGHSTANVYAATANTTMAPLPPTGQNLPHENRQPFVVMNFVIALTGIFPARG
jgi:microcystin-dependent protein